MIELPPPISSTSHFSRRISRGLSAVRQRQQRLHLDEGAGDGDAESGPEPYGTGVDGHDQRSRRRRYGILPRRLRVAVTGARGRSWS